MYVGFDTSNYTTSAAIFNGGDMLQYKKILNVRPGERGLRQSEAVFQHVVNMPQLLDEMKGALTSEITAVGVSCKPRNIDGSYMPCFLAGVNTASAVSAFSGARMYETSHQQGHILSALYSVNRLDLVSKNFIAFHLSGGTTEALLVSPDNEDIIKTDLAAQSTDLKAGQAVDRTGVMLGLKFPCGAELEKLAERSNADFKIKPSVNERGCSFSGVENKVKKMIENGYDKCDIAKFVISYISVSIEKTAENLILKYGDMPMVFAGGVSSNKTIKKNLSRKFGALFAEPAFSSDNAAGIAVYAYLKSI
ncbi:MAG: peptidase M22 [Clostridiales bacterium]|nr:peptidase M22 [Clostridiales bacterium]